MSVVTLILSSLLDILLVRKLLEIAAESPASSARFVGRNHYPSNKAIPKAISQTDHKM